MPAGPFNPTATKMMEARINVMSVMPDTRFVPTIAIALATTVVIRKAITPTNYKPMAAWNQL